VFAVNTSEPETLGGIDGGDERDNDSCALRLTSRR
jgi:hypothetical protein